MNWLVLKGLNELYTSRKVKKSRTVLEDCDMQRLIHTTKEVCETSVALFPGNDFDSMYEAHHKDNFERYQNFLLENNLARPQIRFEEADIKILMEVKELMDRGDLADLRQQIIDSNETVRGVSLMYFKHEKYLDNRESLVNALKQILKIDEFANEKDQQYIYKLECNNPKAIVLCENLYFLMRPLQPRKHAVELWYAGGKNILKLDFADTRGLPIFYSCDWDYDGLQIYGMVKEKIPNIKLLNPTAEPTGIAQREHRSKWKCSNDPALLSELDASLFTEPEQTHIKTLITQDKIVVEEANDFVELLELNNCIGSN